MKRWSYRICRILKYGRKTTKVKTLTQLKQIGLRDAKEDPQEKTKTRS